MSMLRDNTEAHSGEHGLPSCRRVIRGSVEAAGGSSTTSGGTHSGSKNTNDGNIPSARRVVNRVLHIRNVLSGSSDKLS
eukprot:CAMPEP_0179029442 /NCGR_PEP_ID=MMETSP0796-20121207/10058_1 /TAXON_ID=73915 /ORGANISM="Pyrodinium bahamense, Strain pbaha01" /LENGTH=78 /DNA_ID=CAMNT_0020725605 /DNA_START=30 /DNA_END=263 /DNA_ORIENTATION=+